MPTTSKRWQIAPPAPQTFLDHFSELHPLVAKILYNRGLVDPTEASAFLKGHPGPDDPFDLYGMDKAVTRLRQALQAEEPIAVYGDFDADGVTATALLILALRAIGGIAQPYIPHRVEEGYGLNNKALEELAQAGVGLVVTVDTGIRFPSEITYARQLGMDVIVTDHHIVGEDNLDAVAIINPHQAACTYPYKNLAGVGLAYKLAQALLRTNQEAPARQETRMEERDLLDLVAVGTVADLAPLTDENRSLVIRGLERINNEPRPGMEALMHQAGLQPGDIDASAIGFALAPRLNAAGRVDDAHIAYQLLTTEYPAEAERLAQRLDSLNRERQQITAETQEKARRIAYAKESGQPLLFIAASDFPAGIVGLVASRLAEEFYRPAIIIEQGDDTSRGSARSIPEFHITRALDACANLLVQHGGHAAAGGFTTRTTDLPELKARLLALATEELAGKELAPVLSIDAEIPLQEMGWQIWETIQQIRPFGEGNPEPLFVSRNVQVRHRRAVGRDKAHLKLLLFDGRGVWDGIAFRQGEQIDRLPDQVDVAYHLQRNEWNGEVRLQLNIQDIHPSGHKGYL